jgi:hypothetical protein
VDDATLALHWVAQTVVHAPQLFGSLVRSTSQPSV